MLADTMVQAECPPLVSILIPCWGCRRYIKATMRSALCQTYPNLEIIVVEDAGSDGTFEAAQAFQADSRVTVLRNKINLGQHRNKNRALEIAHGKLIKFLDGDDILVQTCVEDLVKAWRETGGKAGLVVGLSTTIDEEGRLIGGMPKWGISGCIDGRVVLANVTKRYWSGSVFGNVSNVLLVSDIIQRVGGFPDDNNYYGDFEVYCKMLCLSDVVLLNKVICQYRRHSSSISGVTRSARRVQDHITMVGRVSAFAGSVPGSPKHLLDKQFESDWKLQGAEATVIRSYIRKALGVQTEYDELKNIYNSNGIGKEFLRFTKVRLLPCVLKMLYMRIRVKLGRCPSTSPFGGRLSTTSLPLVTTNVAAER